MTALHSPFSDSDLESQVRDYFGPRAIELDACECTAREGIARLNELGLTEVGVYGQSAPADLERMCEILATVAMDDMAQAFSLWCHRMALEYVHQADLAPPRQWLLPALQNTTRLGSTSFAAATANYLAGTPLSLSYRRMEGGIIVNGLIAWASNLEPPFASIAGAANQDDPEDRVVFAYTEATDGLVLPPYPSVLALQATNSTSPQFKDAFIPDESLLTWDFMNFVGRVLPTFLLLQSSFCWGLATRSLMEASQLLGGNRVVFQADYDALVERFEQAQADLRSYAASSERDQLSHQKLLRLRLEWGSLAQEAVRLEAKLAGGRGYMQGSGTARRLREAAFLPVQSPTEVQLRWLLSRYE